MAPADSPPTTPPRSSSSRIARSVSVPRYAWTRRSGKPPRIRTPLALRRTSTKRSASASARSRVCSTVMVPTPKRSFIRRSMWAAISGAGVGATRRGNDDTRDAAPPASARNAASIAAFPPIRPRGQGCRGPDRASRGLRGERGAGAGDQTNRLQTRLTAPPVDCRPVMLDAGGSGLQPQRARAVPAWAAGHGATPGCPSTRRLPPLHPGQVRRQVVPQPSAQRRIRRVALEAGPQQAIELRHRHLIGFGEVEVRR